MALRRTKADAQTALLSPKKNQESSRLSSVKIIPTVAIDAVESEEALYDGFYNDHIEDESANSPKSAICAKIREERESRLVRSIFAFCQTMDKAKRVDFAKRLNEENEMHNVKRAEEQKKYLASFAKENAGKKRIIEVAATFLMLSDVETFRENFGAEVMIMSRWREPALDHWSETELKKIEYDDYFNPNLYVENLIAERRVTITNDVYRNSKAETFMVEKVLLRGTFSTPMSMKTFPFDVQDLRIVVSTDLSVSEVHIVPNEHELSSLKIQQSVDQLRSTYYLYDHVEMTMTRIQGDTTGTFIERPGLEVAVRVARKPQYYWINMFAIVFFITQLGAITFVIDPSSGAARTQVASNLFLTSVNLKLTVSLSMPKFAYLTCVDIYIIASIASIFMLNLWHCIVPKFGNSDGTPSSSLNLVDRYAMITIIGLYCLWNLVYFLWLRYSVCKRRYEMKKLDSFWLNWTLKKLAWFKIRQSSEM